MIPRFREWDRERKDYDMGFTIWFSHIEDLDLINNDGTIDRIVMMSTGLKDAHGTEIYEKDIVRDSYGDIYLIEWLDGGFVLTEFYNGGYDHYIIKDSKSLEIIGNKYEHPHLLEE